MRSSWISKDALACWQLFHRFALADNLNGIAFTYTSIWHVCILHTRVIKIVQHDWLDLGILNWVATDLTRPLIQLCSNRTHLIVIYIMDYNGSDLLLQGEVFQPCPSLYTRKCCDTTCDVTSLLVQTQYRSSSSESLPRVFSSVL